ncbi:Increased rDNA silencing protein [Coniosporium tulheliwenetii]|uniref:Increased rDNA silencing protein n=1 Tax=Coniosporium tulheliwenetii TaxID=3383036 RepID=A0ACC2YU01_9PEZI|nr:Increased rDNA silencing protein [Cladosporium sp. JES 115]
MTSIVALVRRELPHLASNPKVKVVVLKDFTTYPESVLQELSDADACIWSMGTYAGDPAVDVEYPLAFANSFAKTLRGRTEKFRLLFLSGALAEQDQNKTLWFYQAARRAKPTSKSKPVVSPSATSNGVLVVGYNAGTPPSSKQRPRTNPQQPLSRSPLSRQNTGDSQTSTFSTSSLPATVGRPATSGALPASAGRAPLPQSPSAIAASLAAARHTPQAAASRHMSSRYSDGSSTVPGGESARAGAVRNARARLEKLGTSTDGTRDDVSRSVAQNTGGSSGGKTTDNTPIAPTTSLVQLFEQNEGGRAKPSALTSARVSREPPGPVKPPKPTQPTPVRSTPASAAPSQVGSALASRPRSDPVRDTPERANVAAASTPSSSPYEAIRPVISLTRTETAPSGTALTSSSPLAINQQLAKTKPMLPPPRRTKKEDPKADEVIASTPAQSQLNSIAPQEPERPSRLTLAPPDPLGRPAYSAASSYQTQSLRQITPHMTGDSLANAIVGAALASSRGPSPAKFDAPPLPERRHHLSRHHKPHHHHPTLRSHSHSPPKAKPGTLRRTLREPESSSSSDEDDRYKKRTGFMRRKHPNKHHEGDRKRWRDRITERERKRYEGVWAANRGLHISDPAAEDDVLNLVVRDIWSRSRLPGHVLEEVWDLVDGRGVGRLGREEFVVGLWLIDQVLKGRKLPTKVNESVWQSVKYAGIKVKLKT